jgi:predicted aspartyl protease
VSVSFDARRSLIVVRVKLWGPNGATVIRMALDTGSTSTLVNFAPLITIGYDPASSTEHTHVATGSGVDVAPQIVVERIEALQQTRRNLCVVCHTLPGSTRMDGLLGLDFLRDKSLLIDFRKGEITLS